MYVPGKQLTVADVLLRAQDPSSEGETADSDPGLLTSNMVQVYPSKLKQIQETAIQNPTLQQLAKYIQ